MSLTYLEILKLNQEYKRKAEAKPYDIKILSNITINQISPLIEFEFQKESINVQASIGNYDNLMQDSIEYKNKETIIIFWELSNIVDGFQYKANLYSSKETEDIISRVKSEIDFVLDNLKNTKLVIFNRFSTLLFNQYFIKRNNFDYVCGELNNYLDQKPRPNVVFCYVDKVIARISIDGSVDWRSFYSSKALYSIAFYNAYSAYIKPIVLSMFGKSKKAIIFDCDNTLWHGILGEDGHDGIQMSAATKKGVYFEEVQYLAKYLAGTGIIVGLNSKNNEDDVELILNEHNKLILKNSEIAIKKINWNDKAGNLKEIAEQLNIGRDSIVFVDDSDFEINLVKTYIPEVLTLQVPKNLYEYPSLLRQTIDSFYNIKETDEDLIRVKTYQTESLRSELKSQFNSIDDYLKSLNLEIGFYCDRVNNIDRIAQLSQKTNQFNLTTKRYSTAEVEAFVQGSDYLTFAMDVRDRFGDFGVTACAIVKVVSSEAVIDIFLLSCRILGRNLEFKFLNEIIFYLKKLGIVTIFATYRRTAKNQQVLHFFEDAGFKIVEANETETQYILQVTEYSSKDLNYITVKK